jgi:hypothetical protein
MKGQGRHLGAQGAHAAGRRETDSRSVHALDCCLVAGGSGLSSRAGAGCCSLTALAAVLLVRSLPLKPRPPPPCLPQSPPPRPPPPQPPLPRPLVPPT